MAVESFFGGALLDRSLLEALERLFNGEFGPSYARKAELALRAFLVAPRLIVSRWSGGAYSAIDSPEDADPLAEAPFGDYLIDYELVYTEPHPFRQIGPEERASLHQLVRRRIDEEVHSVLPKWISTIHEAGWFLDAWYEGKTLLECEEVTKVAVEDEDESRFHYGPNRPLTPEYLRVHDYYTNLYECHPVFDFRVMEQAEYMVGSHRAGLIVFADRPLARFCEEHIFSAWPQRLFDLLGKEFERLSKLISDPQVAFGLPPLLSLLLGRASRRVDIPRELVAMREEYASARTELWKLLEEMWSAESFRVQVKIARSLELASISIVPAAFRSKMNGLELAIDAASMNVAGIAKTLLKNDEPASRVAAISFARRLSRDLAEYAAAHRHSLRRHLNWAELSEWGLN